MQLTADNVNSVFMDCLFEEEPKDMSEAEVVQGIVNHFGLQKSSLEKHREDITTMLEQLPEQFKEGWSFLAACNNKEGVQWTGIHRTMEQLFVLGMAIQKVECLLPREVWPVLPGGMPYYKVL